MKKHVMQRDHVRTEDDAGGKRRPGRRPRIAKKVNTWLVVETEKRKNGRRNVLVAEVEREYYCYFRKRVIKKRWDNLYVGRSERCAYRRALLAAKRMVSSQGKIKRDFLISKMKDCAKKTAALGGDLSLWVSPDAQLIWNYTQPRNFVLLWSPADGAVSEAMLAEKLFKLPERFFDDEELGG